jgi:hypothetical protein
MRRWRWVEPTSDTDVTPVVIEMTENEILHERYPWWARRAMEWNAKHARREGFPLYAPIPVTPQMCLEDFIVVHWAEAVK